MRFGLQLVLVALCFASCTPSTDIDGGQGGGSGGGSTGGGVGGSAGGGAGGGSTGGGAGGGGGGAGGGSGGGGGSRLPDGGFTWGCLDGGLITDAGIDTTALLGPACNPSDLDALIQACRVEPMNFFLERCPGVQNAPAGRYLELSIYTGIYSCAVLGNDILSCAAPRVQECVDADGGVSRDIAAQRIISECSASLGRPRYLQSCVDSCEGAHVSCFTGCRTCGFESCSLCSFECGRQYVDCLRACPPP